MIDRARTLEEIYRDDGDRLWRALVAFSRDPDVASDAVAEAYAQALRRGPALRDPAARVWRTAFRVAAGELDRRRLRARQATAAISNGIAAVDDDLLDALATLPAPQRAALILFYFADLPVRDMTSRTGRSALLIRADLSRGRQRLRRLLGDTNA